MINRKQLRWGRTSIPFGIEFNKFAKKWRLTKEKRNKKEKVKEYDTQEKAIKARDKKLK